MPPVDFSTNYNTPLSKDEEKAFQSYVEKSGKANDLFNYDLRGAWKAKAIPKSGHGPDTYKKPNHPTFSDESIYSGPYTPGGKWTQDGKKWKFEAAPFNLTHQTPEELQQYFQQYEKGNDLVLPAPPPPPSVMQMLDADPRSLLAVQ